MELARRLVVPDRTEALLFDLDGVIIDSLALDLGLVPREVEHRWPGHGASVTPALIRSNFARPVPDFWHSILSAVGITATDEQVADLIDVHTRARSTHCFLVLPGVREIMAAARVAGLKVAVVSNNISEEITSILAEVELGDEIDVVIGLERSGGVPKPHPAIYLEAAQAVGAIPEACVALEDSSIGAAAAAAAGCWVVGVATGATSFEDLVSSGHAHHVWTSLAPAEVELTSDDPRDKDLHTPNEFVTHMVEHVLWRMGSGGRLVWRSDDWHALGVALGRSIARKLGPRAAAAVLGMIDDGSCETVVARGGKGASIIGAFDVDVDWFLGLAAEQARSGAPLVQLLEGLSEGTDLGIQVRLCSVEDPHHTWEGVFRSVGICFAELGVSGADYPAGAVAVSTVSEQPASDGFIGDVLAGGFGWTYAGVTASSGRIQRETAESVVAISVDLNGPPGCSTKLEVSDTIAVDEIEGLLDRLAQEAQARIEVEFRASALSSSHVVAEDIGLALGKLLLKLAEQRWLTIGMAGAGSSVRAPEDLAAPVRVALSIEGRKFWKFVSLNTTYADLRRGMLVGRIVGSHLRSEDLDDFVDGLSGGLGASVMVHVSSFDDSTTAWSEVFAGLGRAIRQAFAPNARRKGLPPGVKATLM